MLKDGLSSCCPPPWKSWLKLAAINSISHDLFSRFKIHRNICYSSSVCLFIFIFSVGASSWDAEKSKVPCIQAVAVYLWRLPQKQLLSCPLCFAYKSQHQKLLFFIKGWSNKCPNSGSSMLNIFPWCLTNLKHSSAEIVLCRVNADSSGNVGTFFYVL